MTFFIINEPIYGCCYKHRIRFKVELISIKADRKAWKRQCSKSSHLGKRVFYVLVIYFIRHNLKFNMIRMSIVLWSVGKEKYVMQFFT